jgi:hypothetical protein
VSIPFTISTVHGGLSTAQGTVWLTPEHLELRIQTRLLHFVDLKPLTIKVPPTALREVRLKRALVGKDTLILRPDEPDLLAHTPGRHTGCVELKVERRYRREVEGLVREVRDWARLDLYE